VPSGHDPAASLADILENLCDADSLAERSLNLRLVFFYDQVSSRDIRKTSLARTYRLVHRLSYNGILAAHSHR
jgi:hypothetical protein